VGDHVEVVLDTIMVRPLSTKRSSRPSRWRTSLECRPVVGSSST
jgi:hypothetical protein